MTLIFKESDLQTAITDHLKAAGYLFRPGLEGVKLTKWQAGAMKRQGMSAGFPDLEIYIDGGTTLFIEIKRKGNTLTPSQRHLHERLVARDFEVHTLTAATPDEAVAKLQLILNGESQ